MNNIPYAFTQNKVNNLALSLRSLICGVATNDADYVTQPTIDGKNLTCPYYRKWQNMLTRCYSEEHHKRQPTHIVCSVHPRWLLFSNFRKWMKLQVWEGLELDKDINVKGNKIYAPNTCLFIPKALNVLLTSRGAARGDYPQGVDFLKSAAKYRASLRYGGKGKYLGLFETVEEASACYNQARKEKIKEIISCDAYPMATQYLEQHIGNFPENKQQ